MKCGGLSQWQGQGSDVEPQPKLEDIGKLREEKVVYTVHAVNSDSPNIEHWSLASILLRLPDYAQASL